MDPCIQLKMTTAQTIQIIHKAPIVNPTKQQELLNIVITNLVKIGFEFEARLVVHAQGRKCCFYKGGTIQGKPFST